MAGDVLDDPRLTLVGLLFETSEGLKTRFERQLQNEVGLGGQWFEILLRLARSPEQSLRMTDLAAQVNLTPSGLTRAVDRLSAAGLVERRECPNDRRGAYACVTPVGLAKITDAIPLHLAEIDACLVGQLDADELVGLEAVLRKLRDVLRPEATQMTPMTHEALSGA